MESKPECRHLEFTDGGEHVDSKVMRTVTCVIVCKPCRGCGDPHYVDGCLKCGYGIDGNFGNERYG